MKSYASIYNALYFDNPFPLSTIIGFNGRENEHMTPQTSCTTKKVDSYSQGIQKLKKLFEVKNCWWKYDVNENLNYDKWIYLDKSTIVSKQLFNTIRAGECESICLDGWGKYSAMKQNVNKSPKIRSNIWRELNRIGLVLLSTSKIDRNDTVI